MDNSKKNIIIIVIDAFRPKNLNLFDHNKTIGMNITEIAKQSILFRNHFSASNCTAPSLTSIFTGLYPNKHGIIHQLPYTKQEEIEKVQTVKFWLPEYLKNNGYETIAIDWIGFWFKRGFDYYGEGGIKDLSAPFRPAKDITGVAISKIKQSTKPFFLFLHFWDTHFPFPHTEYKGNGDETDIKKTLDNIENEKQREYLRKRILGKNLYTIQDMITKYELSIEDVDKQLKKIYQFLKTEQLWDKTIFMVMGDHGVNLTEHGIYFNPSGLYDDSIHTLLTMYFPGMEAKEINAFVQNIDIVPTILDYLEIKTENTFDGKSLIPLIKNNHVVRENVLVFDGLCADIKAIRTKSKKLILAKDNFCNLCKASHHNEIEEYDLYNDPKETTNIYSGKSELMKYLGS